MNSEPPTSRDRALGRTTAELACLPAAFVLAGGQSRRMGRDKALLPFAGAPLIVHAVGILRDAGLDPVIAGARASLELFASVLADPEPDQGPLAGICTALATSKSRWNVIVPVDMPLLPASLVSALLWHAQITDSPVTFPSINGFAQTFPVVVDRALLAGLAAELAAGRRGCFSAFVAAAQALHSPPAIVPAEGMVQTGHVSHPQRLPAFCWFLNVNTPADLRRAERLCRHPIA